MRSGFTTLHGSSFAGLLPVPTDDVLAVRLKLAPTQTVGRSMDGSAGDRRDAPRSASRLILKTGP